MDYREHSYPVESEQDDADSASEPYLHPYRALLHEPTVVLVGNPSDRADVATSAILGYN
ncbi:hypothetical protein M3I54_30475 [Paraburkholderia sp. CNPSo 3274]|uniref:hypothetical protein n=1 Tax=Paraburkholderia sp. CNPSo 3274 TaxID=2940932 RepID=UPI0020B79DE6|nr:hypothetical protein [Paraburkholderia sp. CNPSo 3274]MCP3711252.1 hypothetical protein [Paraburkholderia sp. CNPSo 3274]